MSGDEKQVNGVSTQPQVVMRLASWTRALRQQVAIWRDLLKLAYHWRRLRAASRPKVAAKVFRRVVIISADPWTLTGSKGDEAMMSAVAAKLAVGVPGGLAVGVTTATEEADAAARSMGFEPLHIWGGQWSLGAAMAGIECFKPDALLLVGADVMDGYYSPVTTARLLVLADLMARRGVKAAILGFSFNATPSRYVRPFFDRLSNDLVVSVRDPISFERFRRFSTTEAVLVADSAFMLTPDQTSQTVQEIAGWVAGQREQGNKVLAFNLHPTLIKNATAEQRHALVSAAVTALKGVLGKHAVSVVLLSHDYRGRDSDDACLGPINDMLAPVSGEKILYPRERMTAAELKAVAGLMDGVVTARMHLAIAALGMGVPVAALTYQDKFHGLFAHFDLPATFLLRPSDAIDPVRLQALIEQFLANAPELKQQVESYLPQVKEASSRNLKSMLDLSHTAEALA